MSVCLLLLNYFVAKRVSLDPSTSQNRISHVRMGDSSASVRGYSQCCITLERPSLDRFDNSPFVVVCVSGVLNVSGPHAMTAGNDPNSKPEEKLDAKWVKHLGFSTESVGRCDSVSDSVSPRAHSDRNAPLCPLLPSPLRAPIAAPHRTSSPQHKYSLFRWWMGVRCRLMVVSWWCESSRCWQSDAPSDSANNRTPNALNRIQRTVSLLLLVLLFCSDSLSLHELRL